jgi:hypothetical protein
VVRAHIDRPIIDTYAIDRTWGRRIGESRDGVVAHRPAKHVAEKDHRAARSGESHSTPTALAGVVLGDVRSGKGGGPVLGPGERKTGADVTLAPLARGGAIALVEPGGEQIPLRMNAIVSKRWLSGSVVMGSGGAKLCPPLVDREYKTCPLKALSLKIA